MIESISSIIQSVRFSYSKEIQLHEGINQVLIENGYAVEREKRIGPRERVEFFLDPGLIIEVKIKGSESSILRQIARYAKCETVKGIILIHADVRFRLGGATFHNDLGLLVPVKLVHLERGSF